MSDFLTNLAARVLAVPSLRPRTRSRFEPASDAGPWLGRPEATEVDAPPQAASAQLRVIASAPMSEQREVIADADVQPPPSSQRRSRDSEEMVTEPAPTRDPATHEVSRSVHTSERHIERVIENRETIVRVDGDAATAPVEEARRDGEPRHRHDEQPPRIERERQVQQAPFVAPDRRPSTQQRHDETPAAPEQVIHVSIGRVEVRAVPSTPAPQRARARTAPMNIEEYAAKKAKGRP
jgi:hypothetical protein